VNYYKGSKVKWQEFDKTDTTPVTVKTGQPDAEWEKFRAQKPSVWKDEKLLAAGKEFAALAAAQRKYFSAKSANPDFENKALNSAVMSAWAFVSGILHENPTRLKKHFALKEAKGKDPLNASALAKGKHKTDPENYRGLGYRTDPKERGRFVELFYSQTDKGEGISGALIDLAIKKYHAKLAALEVTAAEEKTKNVAS
jgi:hypothetical protein